MLEKNFWQNKRDFLAFGLQVSIIAAGIAVLVDFYKKHHNILTIKEYPDPILRVISPPIEHIDEQVIALSNDLLATLRYRTMVDFFLKRSVPRGLAAPQVGVLARLVVVGMNGEIKVMINPEIVARSGEYLNDDDCMSVHGDEDKTVKRSAAITVQYKGLDNMERVLHARNRDAALLQHEIDHLNGVLNIDL